MKGCCVDKVCNKNTCMELPDNYTCGDCIYIKRCERMYGVKSENTTCDFFPRRFKRSKI